MNDRLPLSDFASLLALLRADIVVMFAAYFDESGTDASSPYTSVAGYVFEVNQVLRFDQEWAALLQEYGVQCFHMADCAHGRGEFKHLSKPQRPALAERGIGIIKRRARIGIIVSASQAEFARIADLKIVRDPYVMCLVWCLAGVAAWSKRHALQQKISFFFENGHCMRPRANSAIGFIHQLTGANDFYKYHSHSFIGKSEALALQSADLLAWEWRAEMLNTLGPKRRPRRLSLANLVQSPHIYCHLSEDHLEALHTKAFYGDVLKFHDLEPERSLTVIKKEIVG